MLGLYSGDDGDEALSFDIARERIKEQALKKFEKDKQNPFCKYIITTDGKILCADNEWNEYVDDVPPEYNNIINCNSNTYNKQDCAMM
jgi:hypothetical protein